MPPPPPSPLSPVFDGYLAYKKHNDAQPPKKLKSCDNPCLGVPVRIVQDHSVGGLEVDAQPTRPRRQHEHELCRIRLAFSTVVVVFDRDRGEGRGPHDARGVGGIVGQGAHQDKEHPPETNNKGEIENVKLPVKR